MGTIFLALVTVCITLLAYLFYKIYKITKFWEEQGIPHVKPLPILGNSAKVIFMKQNIGELKQEICNRFPNDPVVGYYEFTKPQLLVKDVDLVEKILIKDFMHFTDRGMEIDEKQNPLDAGLFVLTGKKWRALRIKLAPIFTSGKLKYMYGPMNDCGNALISLLDSAKEDVEIKEIFGRFSMDVFGSCAFGIDAGNLAEADTEFHRMAKKQFEQSFIQFLKFALVITFPKIFKFLGISFHKPEVLNYFCNLIKNTLEYRKKNDIKRNDFIQLMMELQDKGYVEIQTKDESDDYLEIDTTAYKKETFEITNDLILGQAFVFLTAGFEASSVALMYTMYELAKNVSIMEKVKEEIKKIVKDDASLSYDAVKEMTYLEQCLKESFRKYPPIPDLSRVCTKEYALPNGYIIQKGQSIIIPITTIHHNPEYYPEPDKYIPERFDPDRTIPSCAYLAFGNGPRMCIAMRFVMMQLKYGLAKVLLHYNFEVSPKTIEPLILDPTNFMTVPKQKVYFTVKKESK